MIKDFILDLLGAFWPFIWKAIILILILAAITVCINLIIRKINKK